VGGGTTVGGAFARREVRTLTLERLIPHKEIYGGPESSTHCNFRKHMQTLKHTHTHSLNTGASITHSTMEVPAGSSHFSVPWKHFACAVSICSLFVCLVVYTH